MPFELSVKKQQLATFIIIIVTSAVGHPLFNLDLSDKPLADLAGSGLHPPAPFTRPSFRPSSVHLRPKQPSVLRVTFEVAMLVWKDYNIEKKQIGTYVPCLKLQNKIKRLNKIDETNGLQLKIAFQNAKIN